MGEGWDKFVNIVEHPVTTLKRLPENAELTGAGLIDIADHALGGHSTLAASVVAKEQATGDQAADDANKARLEQKELTDNVVEKAAAKTGEDVKDIGQNLGSLAFKGLIAVAVVAAAGAGIYVYLQAKALRRAIPV